MVAKKTKPRPHHYDKKLSVTGTFEELVRLSVTNVDVNTCCLKTSLLYFWPKLYKVTTI